MDYGFYLTRYCGRAISEEDWPEVSGRAFDALRRLKRNYRVEGDEEAEAMAICAMADAIAFFASVRNGTGGGMQYASIGSVSVSGKGIYGQLDISPEAEMGELYRCAGMYLKIYRGAGGNGKCKM